MEASISYYMKQVIIHGIMLMRIMVVLDLNHYMRRVNGSKRMFDNLKNKWFIKDEHTRVLRLQYITATLLQDFNTMTKEPNETYIIKLSIVGFNDDLKGTITKVKSWDDAQEKVEMILYMLSLLLEKDLR